MNFRKLLLCAAVMVSLSACGGHGTDTASVDATAPGSPTDGMTGASPAMAFISYLQALVVSMADGLEPSDTSAVVAVADDAGEPVAVN